MGSVARLTSGFKAARLPYEGVPVSTDGQEHVPSAIGPLARSLASIHLVTKHVIEQEPWRDDPRCVPIPWREEIYQEVQKRPLVIGLLLDDGVVKVHPPVERIIKKAAARLEATGHKIVPWSSVDHAECIEVMVSLPHNVLCRVSTPTHSILGSVLHCRRRRRHQARCPCKRRAIHPTRPEFSDPCTCNLSVGLLATPSPEASSSEGLLEEMAGNSLSRDWP